MSLMCRLAHDFQPVYELVECNATTKVVDRITIKESTTVNRYAGYHLCIRCGEDTRPVISEAAVAKLDGMSGAPAWRNWRYRGHMGGDL